MRTRHGPLRPSSGGEPGQLSSTMWRTVQSVTPSPTAPWCHPTGSRPVRASSNVKWCWAPNPRDKLFPVEGGRGAVPSMSVAALTIRNPIRTATGSADLGSSGGGAEAAGRGAASETIPRTKREQVCRTNEPCPRRMPGAIFNVRRFRSHRQNAVHTKRRCVRGLRTEVPGVREPTTLFLKEGEPLQS